MSLQAYRYTHPERVEDIAEFKRQGNPRKLTAHHAPPRVPDKFPRIIKVDERRHRSYHLLFANARSLEDCIYILKRDWWKED